MREVLRPFGKYFLLDQLSAGGMADILRALGPEENGRRRIIVLKKIQQPHADRAEFHDMFWSEIALTMRFRHPNIVRLYDFGEEGDQPFLAMEYIQGLSLRSLVARFHEKKRGFPVEFTLWSVAEAAAGLHYAHHFRDSLTGEALNIVHRDISPHNILVSFDGEVKIIDFGISKASVIDSRTKEGMLKGKPCYMAPEYVHGGEIDHRFDIFALGVVLWEMLCGKRLFLADNDFATLKMVRDCDKVVRPPSEVNPKLHRSLDTIVMRALAKNPSDRYATAGEFRDALLGALRQISPVFAADQFRTAIREVFSDQIEKETRDLNALVERAAIARVNALNGRPHPVPSVRDFSNPSFQSDPSQSLPTAPSLLFPNAAPTQQFPPLPQHRSTRSAHSDRPTPWGWVTLSTLLAAALVWVSEPRWRPYGEHAAQRLANVFPFLMREPASRIPASDPSPAAPESSRVVEPPPVAPVPPAAPVANVPNESKPVAKKKNPPVPRAAKKSAAPKKHAGDAKRQGSVPSKRSPAAQPRAQSSPTPTLKKPRQGRKPFRADQSGKIVPDSEF